MTTRWVWRWLWPLAAACCSCGTPVSLGGAREGAPAEPLCEGRSCGDACSASPGRFCDEKGECNGWQPACTYEPCAGAACGDSCSVCDPNDPGCPVDPDVIYSCTETGECVPGYLDCFCNPQGECAVACSGAPCGEPCSPCAPEDPSCFGDGFACDAFGQCIPLDKLSCDPCQGKLCGEWCDPCVGNPGCGYADAFLCNLYGECVIAESLTTCSPDYLPCIQGMASACGDPCSPCDPALGNCVPPPFDYFCDAALECRPYLQDCEISCATKPCGSACVTCSNSQQTRDPACKPMFCDQFGGCLLPESIQCPDVAPCGVTKGCGEPCFLCDPENAECGPSQFLYCNDQQECSATPSQCSLPCVNRVCGEPCECGPNPDCPPSGEPTFCQANGACAAEQPVCR
jgi:hypothetical protein